MKEMSQILEDIRVIDLTHVFFGPWCTKILAMLGAEVIKIEPTWGELTRFRPPIFGDAGLGFLCLNVGKKGVTLNLKEPEGHKIFIELVEKADVVVNNFMPGTMERLGIGYEVLKEVNPALIYAQLSGFGQTGPYSERPSFAPIAEAYSGFTRLCSDIVDPEGPPINTATDAYGDAVPGTWAALSIIAALRYRDRSGIGQEIDVSQIEVVTHMVSGSINTYVVMEKLPWQHRLDRIPGVGGIFKVADGYVRVAAMRGAQTDRIAKMMGVEDATSEVFGEWISERTVDEVIHVCMENDIPVAPVNSVIETLKDPHLRARGAFVELEEERVPKGKLILPEFPVKFSMTPGRLKMRTPKLGEHNDEVLSGILGYSREEIEQLREKRVIT